MTNGERASGRPVGPGEAAQRLGVSVRTVQRWLRQGRLPSVVVGGRMKVDPSAFAVARRSAEPAAATDDGPAKPAVATDDGPAAPARPIRSLLIANRGEAVVRVARTARALGMTVVGLDVPGESAGATWRQSLDERVAVPGYLDGAAIVAGAVARHVDAVHPGWGFLAEDPAFAEAVERAGMRWVGPPPAAMRALGDKASARRVAQRLGIPTLTGYDGDDQADGTLAREATRIGYPVLLKPSAGGGGKGMHVVDDPAAFTEALARARREASSSFGDDRMVIERYVAAPRHIEMQLLFDAHGNGVHLGERECSLQRRHQKVIEESPSPVVDASLRDRLGGWALALGREAGYVGAGTAEFLLTQDGDPFFLELNARLQVEHPVTEAVTGRDLVEDQLRIAAGDALGLSEADIRLTGHAIEARLYAEDPWAGFVPSAGRVERVRWPPTPEVRIDTGIAVGPDGAPADAPEDIETRFDPMLAKLIAHGPDRPAALAALREAVDRLRVVGITTNRGFLAWLLRHPPVVDGTATTATIDEDWRAEPPTIQDEGWSQAADVLRSTLPAGGRHGFRLNAPPQVRVRIGDEERVVAAVAGGSSEWVTIDGDDPTPAATLDLDGLAVRASIAPPPDVDAAVSHATRAAEGVEAVVAPMPGTIIAVRVVEGDRVEAHQVLVLLEAMKMENAVTAPADATVRRVLVAAGQTVQRGERLVELG